MSSRVVLLTALGLGLAVGIGTTVVERMRFDEPFLPAEFAAITSAKEQQRQKEIAAQATRPKVEFVNDRMFEFGSMERLSKQKHTFLIKNAGNAPLTMKVLRTTCKCTISSLDDKAIQPGETGKVVVEWTGKTLTPEPDFKQGVELQTNDPENERISLVISGYVTETVRALPPDLVLGRVPSKTGTTTEFRLFGFRSDQFEVLQADFEEAATAALFEVTFQPLPPEEVEKEKGATCGVLGRLVVKSGLPLGPINQTIRIEARVDRDVTVHLPISGQTDTDIVIAGPKYDSRRNVLSLGALGPGESIKAVLHVFVHGEYRQETTLSVGELDPPGYLHVSVGERKELGNGKTTSHEVTVEIPAGLKRINRLGGTQTEYGRLVLKTTHPGIPEIPIQVRFAVD